MAFLSACSTQPRILPSQKSWNQASTLKNWRAKGRIKVKIAGDTHSASFDWQQFKQNYTIRFYGPFGLGTSWLRRTSSGVTLQVPEHPLQKADTPEDLMMSTFGWFVPVSPLQHWIKGIPAPKEQITNQEIDELGTIKLLQQAGWTVSYAKPTILNNWRLPGRVVAKREDIEVLIVIKVWSRQ